MGSGYNASLSDLVEENLVSNADGKKFLPLDKIDYIVRSSAAKTALITAGLLKPAGLLKTAGLLEPEGLENFIQGNGKLVFLILVLTDAIHLLEHLREHRVDDSFLPLAFHRDDEGPYGLTIRRAEDNRRHRFCNSWSFNQRTLFEQHMWTLMAPSFGPRTEFRRNFCILDPLPFLTKEKTAAKGFFGEVSRATIHKAHLDSSLWPKVSELLSTRYIFGPLIVIGIS